MSKVTLNYKNKYLEIEGVYPMSNNGYLISFAQLSEGKEKWIEHLKEKNWWDESLQEQFSNTYEKYVQNKNDKY